jgi:hypothetical protein
LGNVEHMGRCQGAVQRSDSHQCARPCGLGFLGSLASSQPRKSNSEMSRFPADVFGAEKEFLLRHVKYTACAFRSKLREVCARNIANLI